jgi:hypothetical protein
MSLDTTPIAGVRGCCHVYYALDIGFSVDLKRCAALLREAREADGFQHHARTPASVDLQPLPVLISQSMEPIQGRTFLAEDRATLTIYDFGAVSVQYRIPFAGTLEKLAELSSELYDERRLAADAHRRAEALLAAIAPAVNRPMVRQQIEDYVVFVIPELGQEHRGIEQFLAENEHLLAQVLSSNTKQLSAQQRREELSGRIAYYADDVTIITWNAALVCGSNMDDVLTVLELANVQLRELHCLDDQLDGSLQESYEVRAKVGRLRAGMRWIRELMLDGQAFSEAVTNAFKPFPDAFLARVYALASRSLGLNAFNQSVKDKLNLLNTLYTTLSDEADHERSVRLEWIVIILILIEIVLGLADRILPLLPR